MQVQKLMLELYLMANTALICSAWELHVRAPNAQSSRVIPDIHDERRSFGVTYAPAPESPPLPPPVVYARPSPFQATHKAGESPAARRVTQPTDSCDSQPRREKMEHRDTDFNILLATDSYKVRYPWWSRGNEALGEGRVVKSENWQSQGGFIISPKAITLFCVAGIHRFTAGQISWGREKRAGTTETVYHIHNAGILFFPRFHVRSLLPYQSPPWIASHNGPQLAELAS